MLKPKAQPATYADIEALPPNLVGEIIFGALHTHARPSPRHAVAAGELQLEIGNPFGRGRGGPGGWIFIVEPELHLGPHVVLPDIAGWRRERLTPFPETAFIETPPDWLAEVLSPSTQAVDRTDKLAVYAEFGVKHLLVRRCDRAHARGAEADRRGWCVGTGGAKQKMALGRDLQGRRPGHRPAVRGPHLPARRAVGAR